MRRFVLVLLVLFAAVAAGSAAPAPPTPTTVVFDYRTAEGVIFHARFDGPRGGAARYVASLREGEVMVDSHGAVSAQQWAQLLSRMNALIGDDMAQVVTEAAACYQISLRTPSSSRTARFTSAVDARQKALVRYFEPTLLPGRIYADLQSKAKKRPGGN